jgi:hypothetical protein
MLCLSLQEKIMKRLLILACVGSLAFALTASAADQNNNPPKKNKGNSNAVSTVQKRQTSVAHPVTSTQIHTAHTHSTAPFRTHTDVAVHSNNTHVNLSNQSNVGVHNQMNVHRKHLNAAITNNWKGNQFSGQHYTVFRNYHREFHDRDWYRHNHSRIVFYFGAPYYWDNGFWFPAWGYNPGFNYDYDGPIASYNGLAPDQVLIAVQTRLQQEGYYHDAVDGTMGPNTRQSLADWQAEHGLAVTAAVDEPTLASMGLG